MSELKTEAKKEVKAKGKTATANVEYTIGQGAQALKKGLGELKKVVEAVEAATNLSETLTNDVATKKLELDALATQFEEKTRQAVVDVELKVKEKKGEAVAAYLTELKQVPVDAEVYTKLQADREALTKNFEAEVTKQVNAATGTIRAGYDQQKKIDEANAKATSATQAAELIAANNQVTFYKGEVDSLRKQLSDEREARVKEAQARGNSQVTVNTTGK